MGAILITLTCRYCSEGRSPHELYEIGDSGALICERCVVKHEEAVDIVARKGIPRECHGCQTTVQALQDRSPLGTVVMKVVWRDGIYQLLCSECEAKYVPKRRDLFAGTPFGKERGL